MAKNAVSDWSATAADNTDIGGVSLAENVMLPSHVNNALREMMAQIKAGAFIGSSSPAFTGNPTAPTPSPGDNDTSIATTAFVTAALASKAPTASPAFTGNPTAPTPTAGDNDTSIATTAFVKTAIAAVPAPPSGQPIPTSSAFPVGATALCVYFSVTALNNGSSTAGSNVKLAAFTNTGAIVSTGPAQSGTWRNDSGYALDFDGTPAGVGYMTRTA